jgi:hypothetical protein
MRKIPVILDVHVEPNERVFDKRDRGRWTGYEKVHDLFRGLRRRIARVTGEKARFVWLFRLDPQVQETYGSAGWPLRRYGRFVEELEKNGDEAGLHTHAWRWDEAGRTWVADHEDAEWVEHCVRLSFQAYREHFGRQAASFQFGDHWMNDRTLSLVENLGARFDLTVEPGHRPLASMKAGERAKGSLPDYTTAPREPYRPSAGDFRVPDPARKDGIWMVPQSVYPSENGEAAAPVFKTLHLGARPEAFKSGVEHLLWTLRRPYLALGLRTCAGIKPARFRFLRENVDHLLKHPFARRFVFTTTPEAMRLLGYC